MYFYVQQPSPTMLALLLIANISWSNGAAGNLRGLTANTLQNRCRTPGQVNSQLCQQACRCECDEYWNWNNTVCINVCDKIDNLAPADILPWCGGYDVLDECDEEGKWINSSVQADMDITYMRAYGRDFKLNFFTDTNRDPETELLPLALVIHGGGFNSGSKNNCKIIESAREVASRGYRTIAINYPMCGTYWSYVNPADPVPDFGSEENENSGWHAWDADEPLYPPYIGQQDEQCNDGAASSKAHPEQYKQAVEVANRAGRYAIEYAHNRSIEWGIDVDKTICHGASAGAVTCYEMLLFNTTVQYKPNKSGLPLLPPELDELQVDVAAGRAGGLSVGPDIRGVTQETVDAMSPLAAVYDLHGDKDPIMPIESAEFLMDVMEEYNIPHYLRVVKGGGHSLIEWQFNSSHPERLDEMFLFFDKTLNRGTIE